MPDKETEELIQKLDILTKLSQEINSTLDLQKVMALVYKNISSLMEISFFIISSYNERDSTVSIEYCVKLGKEVKEEFSTSIKNSTSLTAHTIRTKTEIVILEMEKDYVNYLPGKPQLHGKEDLWCESVVMIPLFVKNKLIGLFSVQSELKNAYSESHIELLRFLSPFMATALNNAQTYQELNNANLEIMKQKKIIEEKNNDIISSIRYAKRIQSSLMPTEKYIEKIINKNKKV